MVLGPDHTPLSKRHGATSVAEFREQGYLPEALANYLALIGWSPGDGEELLPIDELARRFPLEDVGHSAGVFDQEKLAWVNRHYLKMADRSPARGAVAAVSPAGRMDRRPPTPCDLEFLDADRSCVAAASVDRLDQVPTRLAVSLRLLRGRARWRRRRSVTRPAARARWSRRSPTSSRPVGPLLDREAFRAAATRVREQTGQKGKALFHPIRIALTGEAEGPELDLAVPAIERGAALPPRPGF